MKNHLLCVITLLISTCAFSQVPANDNCANAALITSDTACVNGSSRLINQTITLSTSQSYAVTSTCSHLATARDVWYRFVARSKTPTITVTVSGAGWGGVANVRMQLLSGSCGSFTEVACGSGGTLTPAVANSLTEGTTYYIRVHKNTATNQTADHTFTICVTDQNTKGGRTNEIFSRTVLSAAGQLNYPWEVTYGPDGYLWVTESRGYKVQRIDPSTGVKTQVLDLQWNAPATGTSAIDTLRRDNANTTYWGGSYWPQGGFAGLALHPDFTNPDSAFVYTGFVHRFLTHVTPGEGGIYYRNKIVRWRYNGTTLVDPVIICDSLPGGQDHNSQRMIIAPVVKGGKNYLFYASGDMGAGQFQNRMRPQNAQNPQNYDGKILRFNITEDNDAGTYDKWIPNDNPYNAMLGKQSAVYAIGMRNNQGFAYDTLSNRLYGTSHGAYSDDEVNIIQGFRNYGHPYIMGYYGDGNYDGNAAAGTNTSYSAGAPWNTSSGNSTCPPIGTEAGRRTAINAGSYGAYEDPIFSCYPGDASGPGSAKQIWSTTTGANGGWPSEGLTGMEFYSNSRIPGWKKSLVIAGLKWGRFVRLRLGANGNTTLPSNLGSAGNYGDTITFLQSSNRYRDLAMAPNGRDIYVIMDNSSATSGPGTGNPMTPGCAGCLIKYSFLGYASDGSNKSTIPNTVPVAPGKDNICENANTIQIDGTNNYLWVPLTDTSSNIVAEINANGQTLGNVSVSVYHNANAIRNKNGRKYLDRSITITPQNQPSSGVRVRLYVTKAEYDALRLSPGSGITNPADLKIFKNDDACGAAMNLVPSAVTMDFNTEAFGSDAYVAQGTINSFSTFYFGAGSLVSLPLELLSFTGSLQPNNNILLKWQTENEQNTSHFIVERSIDNVSFDAIGNVAASGNTTSITNYSHNDQDASTLPANVIYYRLKMYDMDGSFKYSNTILINLSDIVGRVSVYPNPAHHDIKVTVTAATDGRAGWKITDNSGRVVMQSSVTLKKGNNSMNVNIDKLAAGIYYLNVAGNGIDQNVKLQKL